MHNAPFALTPKDLANATSAINHALHWEGISDVRVGRARCTDKGRLIGITSPTSTLQDLLQHRDAVLRAARTVFGSISDVVLQQRWKWIHIHNVPLEQYMGNGGGLRKLREKLKAENTGFYILADIRWLGGAKVRGRFQREGCGSSSVAAAVLGEAVVGRLCSSGIQLPGGRYEVDAFEETRPDALCLRCGSGVTSPPIARPGQESQMCHLRRGAYYEGASMPG